LTVMVLGATDQELNLMKLPIAEFITSDGIYAAYQDLCRCQADSQWPEMLGSELMSCWTKLEISLQK